MVLAEDGGGSRADSSEEFLFLVGIQVVPERACCTGDFEVQRRADELPPVLF
jgi:hypothetical protein